MDFVLDFVLFNLIRWIYIDLVLINLFVARCLIKYVLVEIRRLSNFVILVFIGRNFELVFCRVKVNIKYCSFYLYIDYFYMVYEVIFYVVGRVVFLFLN